MCSELWQGAGGCCLPEPIQPGRASWPRQHLRIRRSQGLKTRLSSGPTKLCPRAAPGRAAVRAAGSRRQSARVARQRSRQPWHPGLQGSVADLLVPAEHPQAGTQGLLLHRRVRDNHEGWKAHFWFHSPQLGQAGDTVTLLAGGGCCLGGPAARSSGLAGCLWAGTSRPACDRRPLNMASEKPQSETKLMAQQDVNKIKKKKNQK